MYDYGLISENLEQNPLVAWSRRLAEGGSPKFNRASLLAKSRQKQGLKKNREDKWAWYIMSVIFSYNEFLLLIDHNND